MSKCSGRASKELLRQLEWHLVSTLRVFAVSAQISSLFYDEPGLRLRSRLAQEFVPRSSIDPRQRANIGQGNENPSNSTTDAAFKSDYRLVRQIGFATFAERAQTAGGLESALAAVRGGA